MDQQPVTQAKRRILRNDFLFVSGMLVICCIFTFGLIAVPFWFSDQSQKIISANATSTAFAVATQQVHATATAVARATAQAQYEFIDQFNSNMKAYWSTGSINDEYMNGSVLIKGGVFEWKIKEVKQPFLHWVDFHEDDWIKNFDIYVDTKINTTDEASGDVCSGFAFRRGSFDLEKEGYTFSACNNSYFNVSYFEQGKWESISDSTYSNAIRINDWNRLEISARGDHVTFIINNEGVFEMTDDRQPAGSLALFADINETKPVTIWFDNLGFQPHQ